MAGRFHDAEFHSAGGDFIAVFCRPMSESHTGLFTKDDFRSRARGQFAMSADKIRVQVRLDHVFDLEFVRGRFVDILIDVALWIYHYGFTVRADQIRSMSETIEIELLEEHKASCWERGHLVRKASEAR